MNRGQNLPTSLPPFELKVTVTPIGFDQGDARYHNGEYSVNAVYAGDANRFAIGELSRGPDLVEVITRTITKVLEKIGGQRPPE